jgi:hypothetical protein
MNQEDFRKILATPLTSSGAKAPSFLRRPRGGSKPQTVRREGRSDALEQSHVDLGAGFVDRAKERRLAELRGEGGETGEVKGLDFELLKKVRSGEFKLPEARVEEEEEEDEEAILDELLQMERELLSEQAAEKERDSDEEERPAGKAEVVEEKPAAGRFKPIVDAKVLKQMRREHKRRKMAMEGMDRLTKPMPPPPPPPAPKRSRAELLAELRRIQAAKRAPEEPQSNAPDSHTTEKADSAIPDEQTSETMPPPPVPIIDKVASPSPPRQPSPPPPVKVGDNMFSDDSELSDYNPHPDSSSDEDEPPPPKSPQPTIETPVKRNYFGDSKPEEEKEEKKPLTMDPAMAALLRKAAALADKKGIPEEDAGKAAGGKRMGLGGTGGVYEFDEVDEWDGDLEEEELQSRKKRRKEKK